MKKLSKKLSAMMIAFVALVVMLPTVSAQASPKPVELTQTKKLTVTLYNKKDVMTGRSKTKLNEQGLGFVNKKITNLKSSNPSVLAVKKSSHSYDWGTSTYVTATPKKTGTATVSFKINSKTYKIKVTVKKYTNPISYIKIGNTTIKGTKFKSTANYTFNYAKYAGKKTKVTVKLAKGWDFYYRNYFSEATGTVQKGPYIDVYTSKPYASPLGNGKSLKIKGTKGDTFNITVIQKSTGRIEDISVILK